MSILPVLDWLQNTGWATSLKESTLVFPLVEGSHLLALSFSVGMVMVFDLRLLRVCLRNKPAALVMRELMPWSLTGFPVMLGTGFALFASQAVSAWSIPFFRVKMILLALSGLNALYYQLRYYPRMAEWDRDGTPAGVRAIAILSLIFWIGVIACGRTMAYEL